MKEFRDELKPLKNLLKNKRTRIIKRTRNKWNKK